MPMRSRLFSNFHWHMMTMLTACPPERVLVARGRGSVDLGTPAGGLGGQMVDSDTACVCTNCSSRWRWNWNWCGRWNWNWHWNWHWNQLCRSSLLLALSLPSATEEPVLGRTQHRAHATLDQDRSPLPWGVCLSLQVIYLSLAHSPSSSTPTAWWRWRGRPRHSSWSYRCLTGDIFSLKIRIDSCYWGLPWDHWALTKFYSHHGKSKYEHIYLYSSNIHRI